LSLRFWCSIGFNQFGLSLLDQFTPLKIEWIGLIVVGLYAAIYTLLFNRRRALIDAVT
jgi:type II secretory pathway component PulF